MTLSEFIRFSELPKELQEAIWQFAAISVPKAKARVHRIAPSPSYRYTRASAEEVWLTIMPQSSCPVPSLLHVNKHSRDVASSVYELWPCGEIDDKYQIMYIRGWIYVHKEYDIFYFGQREGGNTDASDYWFLYNLCTNKTQYGSATAIAARAKFLEVTKDIKHWGFDSTIWDTRTEAKYTLERHIPVWYHTVFRASSITIVLGNTPEQNDKLSLVPITSGDKRLKVAKKIGNEIRYDFDQVKKCCPQLTIPEFQVMAFSNALEVDYEYSALDWDLSEASIESEFQDFMNSCDIVPGPAWNMDGSDDYGLII